MDDWNSGPLRVCARFSFREPLLPFPKFGCDLADRCTSSAQTRSRRGVCVLFGRLHCCSPTDLWLDEYWLAAYKVPDYRAEARKIDRLFRFHFPSLMLGFGLIVAAFVYKRAFSPIREGFPEYFAFLVLVGVVPAAGFFPTARRLINWRAFSMTLFFILLVSLLWEATLAVPYQWWNYQPKQMIGIRIGAWSGLPIEAVCVWVAVTYATAIVFEIVKLWQASERPAKDAAFFRLDESPQVTEEVKELPSSPAKASIHLCPGIDLNRRWGLFNLEEGPVPAPFDLTLASNDTSAFANLPFADFGK